MALWRDKLISDLAVGKLAKILATEHGRPEAWIEYATLALQSAAQEVETDDPPAVRVSTAVTVAGIEPVERIVVR